MFCYWWKREFGRLSSARGSGKWEERGSGKWEERGSGKWEERGSGKWEERGLLEKTSWKVLLRKAEFHQPFLFFSNFFISRENW